MPAQRFRLFARISSNNPTAIRSALRRFVGTSATVRATGEGFEVHAIIEGEVARDLNRQLLSELRKAEKKTRLRAEWTSGSTTERFFDYVPKTARDAGED